MQKLHLPNVTLLGIDCVNVERLQLALDASQQDIEFGAVKLLTSLDTQDERKVPIPHIGNEEEYSTFCINKLNKYVDTEFFLMVQYDGFVLSAKNWNPDFLNYDYTGAPVSYKIWPQKSILEIQPGYWVGNGGFSLRSKKFLQKTEEFAQQGVFDITHPEDVALCAWNKEKFEKEGLVFAPVELAKTFSVQEDYGKYEETFGFHGLYNKNLSTLLKYHPDFETKYLLQKLIGRKEEQVQRTFKDFDIRTEKNSEGIFATIQLKKDQTKTEIENLIQKVGTVIDTQKNADDFTVTYSSIIDTYTIMYKITKPE